MNASLFDQYQEEETVKPLMRIGDFALVKYKQKEDISCIKEVSVNKKRGITNQRQSVIEEIRTIINQERATSKEKKKYPPITGRALAIKLSHLKDIQDLYFILSQGKDYKKRTGQDFGKYLFGSIKSK